MSLSVISNSNASTNPAASSLTPSLAEGSPGEFAALLSGQSMAAMMSLASMVSNNSPESDAQEVRPMADDSTGSISPLLDPAALAAMIGNLQLHSETGKREQDITSLPKEAPSKDISLSSLSSSNEKPALDGNLFSGRAMSSGGQNAFSERQGTDSQAIFGVLPEKAANIAAERSEKTHEASPFATSLSTASQQRSETNVHQTKISTPLHAETWPQQFSEKIVWLAKNDLQSAQININPAQLGPLQITLNLNGDQASAVFSSPHPEVRLALENSMTQLREMLASAGISLGDTNVGANLTQQNQNNPFLLANKNQSTHENAILPANDNAQGASVGQILQIGRGLVDLFA